MPAWQSAQGARDGVKPRSRMSIRLGAKIKKKSKDFKRYKVKTPVLACSHLQAPGCLESLRPLGWARFLQIGYCVIRKDRTAWPPLQTHTCSEPELPLQKGLPAPRGSSSTFENCGFSATCGLQGRETGCRRGVWGWLEGGEPGRGQVFISQPCLELTAAGSWPGGRRPTSTDCTRS